MARDDLEKDNLLFELESLLKIYRERQNNKIPKVPLSILSRDELGILEALVKYLKENHSLAYSEIAILLNRNDRTIWATYYNANKKYKKRLLYGENDITIPCVVFSNRNLGPLEALTIYLKDNLNLSFNNIATALNRNYQTIWASYNNASRKSELNTLKDATEKE